MELITVSQTIIGQGAVNSVNARELHAKLEVRTRFNDWIRRAIDRYGFEENIDYSKLSNANPSIGVEVIVTLDMAKELCMLDDSAKGRQFRKYFIECEKQAKSTFQIPQTYPEALRLAADLSDENIKLHSVIKQKDEVILAVADLNIRAGDISIGDFSKNLAIENLGRNNLFAWLKARGFLMMNTEPYQPYVERGYFVRKPSDKRVNGEVKYTTMLTAKGSVWLTKMLRAEYNLED